ncbi:MAG: YncE family protein [Planctomycetes bacterium]|nr:YncE family protein [Planctomycetota bacterium]
MTESVGTGPAGVPGAAGERVRYFKGKLLEVRDFQDEQAYHTGRRWFHAAALHGWGTVAGLWVKPHPAGPDGRVLVEPGLALDGLGREILLSSEQVVDVAAAARSKGGAAEAFPGLGRTLYIAARYAESEVEAARPQGAGAAGVAKPGGAGPAAPDRIREGFALEVLGEEELPPPPPPDPSRIRMRWTHTIVVPRPIQAVFVGSRRRLLILGGGEQGTLHVFHADNQSPIASISVGNAPASMAVSTDGKRAWISTSRETSSTPYRILEVDLEELERSRDRAIVAEFPVAGATGAQKGPLRLSADGRHLFGVRRGEPDGTGQVLCWSLQGSRSPSGVPPVAAFPTGRLPWGLALTPDGARLFVACSGDDRVEILDATRLTAPVADARPAKTAQVKTDAEPDRLAVTPAGHWLVVTCRGGRSAQILDLRTLDAPAGPTCAATVQLPQTPVDLLVSATGEWALVATGDAAGGEGRGSVRVLNVEAAVAGRGEALGFAVEVGENPQGLALDPTGRSLYVANPGGVAAGSGAVTLVELEEGATLDLLRRPVAKPRERAGGERVLLAAITRYTDGERIGVDRIDNWVARRLAPPVDVLAEAIRGLSTQTRGAPFPESARISPGGPAVPAALAPSAGAPTAASAPAAPAAPVEGQAGGPAAGAEGTRIVRINWTHGGTIARPELLRGLEVVFDHEVRTACLREETLQLRIRRSNPKTGEYLFFVIPSPPMMIRPGADGRSAALVMQESTYYRDFVKPGDRLLLVLRGDLVLDRNNRPVEAAARFLPNPDGTFALDRTGTGAAGGTFESWFTLT